MKRVLPIVLFVVAVLAFFLIGRLENERAKSGVAMAVRSIDAEIDKEQSGVKSTPADRAEFLNRQKVLLGSIKKNPTAPQTATPRPAQPAAVSSQSLPATVPEDGIVTYMPVIITGVFGIAALWIVLSKGYKADEEARKWAFGILGLIVGYWLKGG